MHYVDGPEDSRLPVPMFTSSEELQEADLDLSWLPMDFVQEVGILLEAWEDEYDLKADTLTILWGQFREEETGIMMAMAVIWLTIEEHHVEEAFGIAIFEDKTFFEIDKEFYDEYITGRTTDTRL